LRSAARNGPPLCGLAALAGAVLLMAAVAAARGPAHYITYLDIPGGLGPGDSITHAGVAIGRVTDVRPLRNGHVEIEFEIDPSHSDEVQQESILLLNHLGATPSLELTYTEPNAPPAPEGSFISGASNATQAQILLAARGANSLTAAYSRLLRNFGTANGPQPTSASAAQMQNDLMALVAATIAASAANAPELRIAIERVQGDELAVEHELLREGNLPAAERLHDDTYRLLAIIPAAVKAPPPSAAAPGEPPNTLDVPRANPSPAP
jgi:ABC-type transporter Mla subunit MlaD